MNKLEQLEKNTKALERAKQANAASAEVESLQATLVTYQAALDMVTEKAESVYRQRPSLFLLDKEIVGAPILWLLDFL